ncbi:MAG: hypothetical protein J3K34DRAFT_445306 [Monoraphidium minutum]|nr:MAG: hypothetical protein J3K34DRAFT_445306 [Monoraphidium minutum]
MLHARHCSGARAGVGRRTAFAAGGGAPLRVRTVAARAGANDDEDLMQHPDRLKWYEVKFAADDMPDWNAATLLMRTDLAPGLAALRLSVEVSRERVPLRNAYVAAGQAARLRVNSGVEQEVPVSSAPPGVAKNKEALFLTRGDMFSGETKTTRDPLSIQAEVEVIVSERGQPELYRVQLDDAIEVGPFQGSGLDLRSSGIMAAFRFPTLVLFVSNPAGIAAAAALIESPPDTANLAPGLRSDVVVYYWVPNEASVCYRERFDKWAALGPVRVDVTTRGFADAFDGDSQLMYDPDTTAAIILTGGDEEAEAAARACCAEAEITTIVSDCAPSAAPVYLSATPRSFEQWAEQHGKAGGGQAKEEADAEAAEANGNGNGKVSVR